MLNTQVQRNDGIRTLLLCIKRKAQEEDAAGIKDKTHCYGELYHQRDTLLLPYLKSSYEPLRKILMCKNRARMTALNYHQTKSWLNPKKAETYRIESPDAEIPASDDSCSIL